MDDEALLRYSRHILLPQLDYAGQQRISESRVLLVGLGGLGLPAALYLAAAGVGQLIIVDDDTIDLANLQRQIGYTTAEINHKKALVTKSRLHAINPLIEIEALTTRITEDSSQQLCADVDVVVDASDNFATRYIINAACVANQKPLVSGAAVGFEGHLLVLTPGSHGQPCYHCLYPGVEDIETPCSEQGIFSPVVGVIGSLQAVETLRLLTQVGKSQAGKLTIYDAFHGQFRSSQVAQDPNCTVCLNV